MQTPDMPQPRSFESMVTERFYGRVQEYSQTPVDLDSANLLGLREEAYRGNRSRNMDTRRERIVAWAAGKAALNPDFDSPSTVRLEAVLRMPYLLNQYVTTATLDVREFTIPEQSEAERSEFFEKHPRAIVGMYTNYRADPAMSRLVVRRGLLTIDPNTNRGIPSSHMSGAQLVQPEREKAIQSGQAEWVKAQQYLLMIHFDREVAKLDSGKVGNLLAPTEDDAVMFENELRRGATGQHTIVPPIRAW